MAVAKDSKRHPVVGADRAGADQVHGGPSVKPDGSRTKTVQDASDYNGMALDDWKATLKKDVDERFGPPPENLSPTSGSGW